MKLSTNREDLTFVYELFKELDILFLLSHFECQMLMAMNVASSQLHPNNWAFLKVFQILCHYLQISPTINKFMYFYQLKHGPKAG